MPIPQSIREIVQKIDAPVNKNDRITLANYLETIESSDELYLRCVRKAIRAIGRLSDKDVVWLKRWLPIIITKEEK